MNNVKGGNLVKLVAFFLIAASLVLTVGFASSGWQSILKPDSDDNVGKNPAQNGNVDENKDGNTADGGNNDDRLPAVNPTPAYTDALTGLEITEEASLLEYLAFVMRSDTPCYGISSAALTIEIPTENGDTRLLVFKNNALGVDKIGSIAPARDYISLLAYYFGGFLVHDSRDDSFDYEIARPEVSGLDFSESDGYSYTEYTEFVYTNGALLNAFFRNSSISGIADSAAALPFDFSPLGEEISKSGTSAVSISVPYSEDNTTDFVFSGETKKYMLLKNGNIKTDMLNDKRLEYDNVFLLFADAVTIETRESTETIIDTDGSGLGYYISRGALYKISWYTDENGSLTLLTESGERLTVNRGSSYIAYIKASSSAKIKIS
ncbi:MAG: DUF3048 C-terminal domain-containing protein [Clostridia bacterium]|nr:DUF3048 C-terminal domain-containing protein [Clostridia bacterium]